MIGALDRFYLAWALLSLGLPPLFALVETGDLESAGWAFVCVVGQNLGTPKR